MPGYPRACPSPRTSHPETPPAAPSRRTRKFSRRPPPRGHPAGATEAFPEGPRRAAAATAEGTGRTGPSSCDWPRSGRRPSIGRPSARPQRPFDHDPRAELEAQVSAADARKRLLDLRSAAGRETDRATSRGPGRYLLLLPETGELRPATSRTDRARISGRPRASARARHPTRSRSPGAVREPLAAIDDAERGWTGCRRGARGRELGRPDPRAPR
jgi:hypothetical protein